MNVKVSATECLNVLKDTIVQKTANYDAKPDKKHRAILKEAVKVYITQVTSFIEQGAIAAEYHGILTKTNAPVIVCQLVDEVINEMGKNNWAQTAQLHSVMTHQASILVDAKAKGDETFMEKVSGTFSNGAKWLWNPETGKIQILWKHTLIILQIVKDYAMVAWNYIVEMWNRLVKATKDCYGRITKKEVVAEAEAEMDTIAARQSNVVPMAVSEPCPA